MRSMRRFNGLAALALAAGLVVAAPAAADTHEDPPAAEYCSGDNLITETLKHGTQWAMCWRTDSLKGLVLEKVSVKAPGDERHSLVLDSIAPVQMHVPYDTGDQEFDDILQYGFGRHMVSLNEHDCPTGELRQVHFEEWSWGGGEATLDAVCIREVDRGLAYRSEWQTPDNMKLNTIGTELLVQTTSGIANYEYITEYRFRDDGQIDVEMGATGDVHRHTGDGYEQGWPVGEGETDFRASHYHSAVWRVDVAIDGSANQRVEQSDTNYQGRNSLGTRVPAGRTTRRDVRRETFIPDEDRRVVRFAAADSLNADGHERMYELEFNKNHTYDPSPHLRYELAITEYDPTQRLSDNNNHPDAAGQSLTDYVRNNRAITDPVVWVNVGHHHIVRDEDQSPMPVHWQGFSIGPRDFWAQNPLTPPEREGWNGPDMPVG
jgi:primary-amine oxidase